MSRLAVTEADAERFCSKVHMKPGCWEWQGGRFKVSGYGLFTMPHDDGKWRPTTAHRVAWEVFVGDIPEGLHIDHLCRNRGCVNPAHLEPVTQRVNTLRGEAPCAKQARQTHCKNGHEFLPENTYRKRNKRECRICLRAYWRERERRRVRRPRSKGVA